MAENDPPEGTPPAPPPATPPAPPAPPATPPAPPSTPPPAATGDNLGQQILNAVQGQSERFIAGMKEAFPHLATPPPPPAPPAKPPRRSVGHWWFGMEAPKAKAD